MTARRRALCGAAAALMLVACASRPPPDAARPWISGRLVVRVDAGAGRQASSVSADFDLRGDHDSGELRLSTPLGTSIAQARWAPGEALLSTGQGEARFADLESLSRETLGEVLPLRALPDWLAGRPWAVAPHHAIDEGFEQLGWVVHLDRYAEGWVLAVREAAPAVKVQVRLERPS